MTTAPLRVLVVDDNVDTARMMKLLLKQGGYEAAMATNGTEAIEVARPFKPDAVLLDLTLPDMSGFEVAARLKGMPELSACVLAAVSGHDAVTLGPNSPIERHFKKPIDHEALMNYLSAIHASRASGCQDSTTST